MGKLDDDLKELMKKQKRANTTNGPHPHHQFEGNMQTSSI
jgi:hypothetical protein